MCTYNSLHGGRPKAPFADELRIGRGQIASQDPLWCLDATKKRRRNTACIGNRRIRPRLLLLLVLLVAVIYLSRLLLLLLLVTPTSTLTPYSYSYPTQPAQSHPTPGLSNLVCRLAHPTIFLLFCMDRFRASSQKPPRASFPPLPACKGVLPGFSALLVLFIGGI